MIRDEFIKMMGRAIGEADNPQIDDSETGEYFWEKYAPHYCGISANVLAAIEAAGLAVVDRAKLLEILSMASADAQDTGHETSDIDAIINEVETFNVITEMKL